MNALKVMLHSTLDCYPLQSTVGSDFIFGFINNGFVTTDNNNVTPNIMLLVSNANTLSANIIITSIFPTFQTINETVLPNTVKQVWRMKVNIGKC